MIDAQLPPSLIPFFRDQFNIKATHVNELEETLDEDIFLKARKINGWILTKDNDFVAIVKKFESTSQNIYYRIRKCGQGKIKRTFIA